MTQITENPQPVKSGTVLDQRRKSESRGFFTSAFLRFAADKISMIALVIFIIIALSAIFAEPISKNIIGYSYEEQNLTELLLPPFSGKHILGTDDLGRDNLVRLLYGGQVSLTVGLLVALISGIIGTFLGIVAGFFGSWLDDLVNAAYQIISNVPFLFLLIILSIYFKPTVLTLALAFGLLNWPGNTRQIRGQVLSLRARDYVDAARVMGASNARIMWVHLIPNIVSTVLVIAGFDVVGAILGESGLSFLGYGISIPVPSWGNMLSDSQSHFTDAPWLVYFPGIMIFITVLCVYLIADGLRDAFDPRLKAKA
jgi:peptide/nickel transport system permease protein